MPQFNQPIYSCIYSGCILIGIHILKSVVIFWIIAERLSTRFEHTQQTQRVCGRVGVGIITPEQFKNVYLFIRAQEYRAHFRELFYLHLTFKFVFFPSIIHQTVFLFSCCLQKNTDNMTRNTPYPGVPYIRVYISFRDEKLKLCHIIGYTENGYTLLYTRNFGGCCPSHFVWLPGICL